MLVKQLYLSVYIAFVLYMKSENIILIFFHVKVNPFLQIEVGKNAMINQTLQI